MSHIDPAAPAPSLAASLPSHIVPAAPVPPKHPRGAIDESYAETVTFDAAKHLQLEPPAYIKMLPNSANPHGAEVRFPLPVCPDAEDGKNAQTTAYSLHENTPMPFSCWRGGQTGAVSANVGVSDFVERAVCSGQTFAGHTIHPPVSRTKDSQVKPK